MRTLLRRLRGVAMTALVWAVAWGLGGVALLAYGAVRNAGRPPSDVAGLAILVPLILAVVGGVSGAVFAAMLAVAERRRTLDQLTTGRVAAWGAVGGLTMPLVTLVDSIARSAGAPDDGLIGTLVVWAVFATLGAGCAAGTLALARRPAGAGAEPG